MILALANTVGSSSVNRARASRTTTYNSRAETAQKFHSLFSGTSNNRPPVKLESLGLLSIGKSATPELGLTPTTEGLVGEPCRNPWDPTRSVGGSSGGAACLVAAGDQWKLKTLFSNIISIFTLQPSGSSPVERATGLRLVLQYQPYSALARHHCTNSQHTAGGLLPTRPLAACERPRSSNLDAAQLCKRPSCATVNNRWHTFLAP